MHGIVKNELFNIRPAGDWIEGTREQPAPRMIFDRFWTEGELCVLFGDHGKGKSVLAVQIADAISRGSAIAPFKMQLPAQKVLYLDLELPDKQFEMRYSARVTGDEKTRTGDVQLADHYQFSPDLLRACPSSLDYYPTGRFESYREYFNDMLHSAIHRTGAKVIVIDNLAAYVNGGPRRASEVADFFRALHDQKRQNELSILVLAHSRKVTTGPLTLNHLELSRLISHFADSVVALGGSCGDPGLRYLKQLKNRSSEPGFDELNVPVFRIGKQGGNFLSFSFIDFGVERDLVQNARDVIYETRLMDQILELSAAGRSQRDIAASLGISKNTVNRYLQIDARLVALEIEEQRQKQRSAAAQHQEVFSEQAAERRPAEAAEPPVSPAEAYYDPDDEKCDCIECLAGRPRRCLEKFSTGNRASPT